LRFNETSVLILNDPGYFRGFTSRFPLKSDLLIINSVFPGKKTEDPVLFYANQLLISSAASKNMLFYGLENCIVQADSVYDIRTDGSFSKISYVND